MEDVRDIEVTNLRRGKKPCKYILRGKLNFVSSRIQSRVPVLAFIRVGSAASKLRLQGGYG